MKKVFIACLYAAALVIVAAGLLTALAVVPNPQADPRAALFFFIAVLAVPGLCVGLVLLAESFWRDKNL